MELTIKQILVNSMVLISKRMDFGLGYKAAARKLGYSILISAGNIVVWFLKTLCNSWISMHCFCVS